MKNLFLTCSIVVGATVTCAAQKTKVFVGSARVSYPSQNTIVVTCTGQGTCATVYPGMDGHWHLSIPAIKKDFILTSNTVSSRPIEEIPDVNPNGEYDFLVKNPTE
ncbi:hypothetical protein ACLI08_00100 [Flavobacterium sp. RNTU_13]|uniref:hypothetical protein n=1 Tax=Flavobacterium sp. RNTU_13 TaxID=3375145 RepID=UPI0039887B20